MNREPPLNIVASSIRILHQHLKDPLYRNSYYLIANTAVTSALGFFFWIVVARFYNDADVGLASTIISCMGLLVAISSLGFNFSLVRFLNKSDKPVEFINSTLTITGIVAIFTALIFVIGIDLWSPLLSFIKDSPVFAGAFIAFSLCLTLTSILDFIFIAKRKAGYVLSKNIAISLLKIVLPFILVLFFRSFGIVSSVGIATGMVVIIFLLFFLPRAQITYRPRTRMNLQMLREVWRYSAGSYLANIISVATTFILLNFIVHMASAEEAAYFYVAWMIANVLFIIPNAISQSSFAEGSHFEGNLIDIVKRSYKFTFMLLIPAIAVLLLTGKWLLLAFGAGYSENGVELLRFLALSGIFVGVNGVYSTILRVQGKITELVGIVTFIAIVTITGSYFFIPLFGITGIGYSWFAARLAVSIYVIFFIKRTKQ